MSETLTFFIPGQEVTTRSGTSASASELSQATTTRSIRLDQDRGATGELLAAQATPGRDIVMLEIQNGPRLYLHPEHARDLLRAQQQRPGQRGMENNHAELPPLFDWPDVGRQPGEARGVSNVLANTFSILSGNYIAPVADWASSEIVRRVDNQVERGLYALTDKAPAGPLKDYARLAEGIESSADPMLVLIHGTFSNTFGTFSKLWNHPQLVDKLFKHYGKKVFALEHWTLAASPIENALELANAVPNGTKLHLLTHSRGGLVAEVLARACGAPDGVASVDEHFDGSAYQAQRSQLKDLLNLVQKKKLSVERVVRVACPARGTLLASKRLDAYLSVLKWTLELANIPVAPTLVEFLGAVAQHRTDPEQIPGLAAQMPDNPLVRWLHAADAPVPGELRVVAGDVAGDSVGSWIKTLVSDAYYWQDNDFVVQTSSMYGGVPREPDSTFVLARAGDVSHFSYFARPETAGHIVDGLTAEAPRQFASIGPESKSGKSSSGIRAPDERPAVIVLPGILGSNLRIGKERVWLSLRTMNGLGKLRYEPDDKVKPDGPIAYTYDGLIDFLGKTHDVIEFAYDWRRPLQEEAGRLAQEVMHALAGRKDQPVRILAHSMGGLLARVFQLTQPKTWELMFSRPGARLLMLGTPNGGSWAPMQVLSGDDDFGNWLPMLGAPFEQKEARQMMAAFPGFVQMQAGLLDDGLGLAHSDTWSRLASLDEELLKARSIWHRLPLQLKVFAWGIPPQKVLDDAVTLRRALDAQAAQGFPAPGGGVVMVVGHAEFTPDGFESGKNGIVYREAVKGGDGRVTLPAALLPGVQAWKVDREHGDLPREEGAFDAYLDLLVSGTTQHLDVLGAFERGKPGEQAMQVERILTLRHLRQGRAIPPDLAVGFSASLEFEAAKVKREPTLDIQVINGNLKFVSHPVIVGHYSSSQLTGTERALDELIGGAMSATLDMGCYPNACSAHQIFANVGINLLNPLQQMPRPAAVVVVGLGLEGALTVTDLTKTVAHGVIAWAQRLRENPKAAVQEFNIAATLIGSGGVNMSAESSARAVARGVIRANARLRALGWPTVGCLEFIELYLDRATEALRALRLLAEAEPGHYSIHPDISSGTGPQRRALGSGYRGAHYDLISALHEQHAELGSMIVYSLNSRRAREDVHASRQQVSLIELLIKDAANSAGQRDPQVGKTLFKLLVPPEIEPFLTTSEEMQIELNEGTAAIPWELLDSDRDDMRDDNLDPWAIRSKLLRCLRTVGLPLTVNDASGDAHFLVIGEPENLEKEYPPLPGARREAQAVADILTSRFGDERVLRLIQGEPGGRTVDAPAVVGALLERDWRVVHIAGHGALPPRVPNGQSADKITEQSRRGVVLSDGAFLGADEISAMRVVPALVFVNCCHLGNMTAGVSKALPEGDMPRYAASVAEALIRKGVRCVLVAGWAVDDKAARIFAECFYERLKDGARFIEAVADARRAARKQGGNTWAAYQCYGDPNWTLTSGTVQQAEPNSALDDLNGIASPSALVLTLESIITSYRYESQNATFTLNAIKKLKSEFGKRWGNIGVVAEAFGLACLDLNDYAGAVEWFSRAVKADDATASMRTVEKFGDIMTRLVWREVRDFIDRDGKNAAAVSDVNGRLKQAIDLLTHQSKISPTAHRHALLGSAHKRRAMVRHALGRDDWHADLQRAIDEYEEAQEFSEKAGQEWYRPVANARIARMVLESSARTATPPFGDGTPYMLALEEKNRTDPDFYSTVAHIEARMYDAIALDKLADVSADIQRELRDLYLRARGTHFWGPVLDQLDFVDLLWARKVPLKEKAARKELRRFLSQCQL